MPAALKILFVYMSEHIFSDFVVVCVCFQETCMHSTVICICLNGPTGTRFHANLSLC